MIIAIDFDGTICRGEYPRIEGLVPGAKNVINRLYDEGHYLIIWTCRAGTELTSAVNFLLANGIKFHRVNDNSPEMVEQYGSNSRKIFANLYIDDHQVGGFSTWNEIYDYVKQQEDKYKT